MPSGGPVSAAWQTGKVAAVSAHRRHFVQFAELLSSQADASASRKISFEVTPVNLSSAGCAYSRFRYAQLRIEELNSRETNVAAQMPAEPGGIG